MASASTRELGQLGYGSWEEVTHASYLPYVDFAIIAYRRSTSGNFWGRIAAVDLSNNEFCSTWHLWKIRSKTFFMRLEGVKGRFRFCGPATDSRGVNTIADELFSGLSSCNPSVAPLFRSTKRGGSWKHLGLEVRDVEEGNAGHLHVVMCFTLFKYTVYFCIYRSDILYVRHDMLWAWDRYFIICWMTRFKPLKLAVGRKKKKSWCVLRGRTGCDLGV